MNYEQQRHEDPPRCARSASRTAGNHRCDPQRVQDGLGKLLRQVMACNRKACGEVRWKQVAHLDDAPARLPLRAGAPGSQTAGGIIASQRAHAVLPVRPRPNTSASDPPRHHAHAQVPCTRCRPRCAEVSSTAKDQARPGACPDHSLRLQRAPRRDRCAISGRVSAPGERERRGAI